MKTEIRKKNMAAAILETLRFWTVRWRSNGEWSCPVVLRVAVGGYIKGGPWHSACFEGVPFGKGRVRREGNDLTIVTWGSMVYTALEVARQMEAQGRSLEMIDLRSTAPFDEEMVYRSVRKTNRVNSRIRDSLTMGFGAEIAAPVRRVAAKDLFVPSAPNLELAVLPSVEGFRAVVEETLRY
jgi:pyruvate/2-oxoglutarate/acetoin dehydrogenase E1 component